MSSTTFSHPSSSLFTTTKYPLSLKQETQSIHPSLLRQAREKKMSITRTYALARTARAKLSCEASKHNHDLRLLVGHANLLDSLMIALAEAEKAQEEWFNEAIRGNMADEEEYDDVESSSEESSHQWLETDYDSDSDSEMSSEEEEDEDEDEDEMEFELEMPSSLSSSRKTSQQTFFYPTVIGVGEVSTEEDEDGNDEEDQDGLFALTRTTSHRPPQLVEDNSDDEDDESTPPSPPQPILHSFPKGDKNSISSSEFFGQLPHPPRLTPSETDSYFRSEYYQSTSMIESY